jgi:hypothetical protein
MNRNESLTERILGLVIAFTYVGWLVFVGVMPYSA